MHGGQTVQDRPIVCMEVEEECGDEIFIGTIFGPPRSTLTLPNWVKLGSELNTGIAAIR